MGRRILVTVVGLGTLACSGVIPAPPDALPFDPPPPLGVETPYDPARFPDVLNPAIPGRGRAYRAGGRCYVHGDFDRPPKAVVEPPREFIDCPAALQDGAWEACAGGTVHAGPDGCLCDVMGNPPPPTRAMVCPKT